MLHEMNMFSHLRFFIQPTDSSAEDISILMYYCNVES